MASSIPRRRRLTSSLASSIAALVSVTRLSSAIARPSQSRRSTAWPSNGWRNSRRSRGSGADGVQRALMGRRVRNWVAVWCGWTALALFFAVSASLTYLSTGRDANWALSIRRSLLEWWLWALLTPIVVWLARRYPLDRHMPWRHGLIHAAAGAALAIVKTAAERAMFAWLTGVWTYWL